MPDQNPSPPLAAPLARAASGWKILPAHSARNGASSMRPTNPSRITASVCRRSCGSPSASSTRDAASVKATNASARPIAIPNGRRRPPVVDVARTTGMIGSTHGERKVATPATSAARKSVMLTRPC